MNTAVSMDIAGCRGHDSCGTTVSRAVVMGVAAVTDAAVVVADVDVVREAGLLHTHVGARGSEASLRTVGCGTRFRRGTCRRD